MRLPEFRKVTNTAIKAAVKNIKLRMFYKWKVHRCVHHQKAKTMVSPDSNHRQSDRMFTQYQEAVVSFNHF